VIYAPQRRDFNAYCDMPLEEGFIVSLGDMAPLGAMPLDMPVLLFGLDMLPCAFIASFDMVEVAGFMVLDVPLDMALEAPLLMLLLMPLVIDDWAKAAGPSRMRAQAAVAKIRDIF
jgi:hypothetical protein